MAKFYDTLNWNEKPFLQTKGTRNKCIVSNPDNSCDYYFKTSIKKGEKDYKSEFWSEIIASEVGNMLGFNVLKYDIALNKEEIGCISQSMIDKEKESLTEGISLLTGYNNSYNPEDKASYSLYTFQFIQSALSYCDLGKNINDIINMIIFDAVIGNSDRHQENWGFITPNQKQQQDEPRHQHIDSYQPQFAPIYDNGCCLAREKSDEAVKQMLKDELMLDSFINRGVAEIRWGDTEKKLNHFELIKRIKEEYSEVIDKTIKTVLSKYDELRICDIVHNIDENLPEKYKAVYGLSKDRKKMICVLLKYRIERLEQIRS